ncbi:MAG: sugar transferase [Bryobacteraceae bacterium]|nr:sugar transferase [Bryobacteraceae bacterium]
MKRLLDIVLSAAGLLLALPVLAAVAAAVWMEDRGSPFYWGIRAGRGGAPFRMCKLRSMRIGADRSGVNSTAADDPRITRVGRFIRRCKLDELTQLWNVLQGDMSLVGPRPQVLPDVHLYTGEERRLLRLRPGVTDAASIVFADEGEILAGSQDPDGDYQRRIRPWKSRLALLYLEHAGIRSDLRLLAWTAVGLLSRRRALQGVEQLLRDWQAADELIRISRRMEPVPFGTPPGHEEETRISGDLERTLSLP